MKVVIMESLKDLNAERRVDLWWKSAQRSTKTKFERERMDVEVGRHLLDSFLRHLIGKLDTLTDNTCD